MVAPDQSGVTRVIGRRGLIIGTDRSQRPGTIIYTIEKITVVNAGRLSTHYLTPQSRKNIKRGGETRKTIGLMVYMVL